MVSVRYHGSPRGPAVPSSGVRSVLTGPTGERRVREELPLSTGLNGRVLNLMENSITYRAKCNHLIQDTV